MYICIGKICSTSNIVYRDIHKYHSECDTKQVMAIQSGYFGNKTSEDGELMLLKTMTMRCRTSRDGIFSWKSKGPIMAMYLEMSSHHVLQS